MNRYFIDTAYLLGLVSKSDQWHAQAVVWARAARGRFFTTDYVLLEVADGLAHANWRGEAVALIDELRADERITIVRQSPELFDRGFQLYRERPDKDWSLTDCLSFAVMADKGLSAAMSSDHHFEQAGFQALLRMNPPAVDVP